MHLVVQNLAGKVGQDEAGAVDILAVVAAQLLLLLAGPLPEGLTEVAGGVLAADHEADLAGGVSGDGGVGILDDGEDLAAGLLQAGDEGEVEPEVLAWRLLDGNELDNRRAERGEEVGYVPWVVMTPPSVRASFRSSK